MYFGLGRVGLDLLAQLIDEDAQVFGLVAVVRTPHGLQDFAMGHGTAGVRHQVAQDLELLRREADVFAVGAHPAGVEIDLQVGAGVAVRAAFGGGGRAPHGGANARQQFLDAEGLGDVIVGAGIERGHFVLLGIAHREDDHRNVRAGADRAAGFQAVHAGHVHIQQHQGGHLLRKLLQRVLAGAGLHHLVAMAHQGGLHHAANLRIVVHHQDLAGAQRSTSPGHRQRKVKGRSLPRFALHPDLLAVRFHDSLCDRQPHAGALGLETVAPAAEELVEDVRALVLVDARRRGRPLRSRSSHLCGAAEMVTGAPSGEYLRAFSTNCLTTCWTSSESHSTSGRSAGTCTVIGASPAYRAEIRPSARLDQLRGGHRPLLQVQFAGLDARHGDDFGGQLVQAVGLFVDDGEQFAIGSAARCRAGW